jgi:dephospho-CoA kinase
MIVGLTGSIATGKSEVARLLRERGIPLFDADAVVHELYGQPGVIAAVSKLFPVAIDAGCINRDKLAGEIAGSPAKLAKLESLVHPLVRERRRQFLAQWKPAPLVVLDIPLLYETGSEKEVDSVIVVVTTPELQRQRALARPGMTEAKLEFILSRQMPMAEKAARADFVINNSGSLEDLAGEVDRLLARLTSHAAEGNRS